MDTQKLSSTGVPSQEEMTLLWHYVASVSSLFSMVSIMGREEEEKLRSITLTQARIFGYLFGHADETIHLKTLAKELGVTMAACSQTVDRLVRQEILDREPDPADRRAVCLHFSKKGHALVSDMRAHNARLMGELLSDVPAADRAVVERVFETLYLRLRDKRDELVAARGGL